MDAWTETGDWVICAATAKSRHRTIALLRQQVLDAVALVGQFLERGVNALL